MMHDHRNINGVRYLRVCRSIDVPQRSGLRVQISLHQDVALFRVHGVVQAVSNVCPHKRESVLCNGIKRDGTIECPLHGWTYDIRTGTPIVGASRLDTYHVFEEDGYVWLEERLDSPPRWASW
jgi:nitrite reductase (NADH) small subunit